MNAISLWTGDRKWGEGFRKGEAGEGREAPAHAKAEIKKIQTPRSPPPRGPPPPLESGCEGPSPSPGPSQPAQAAVGSPAARGRACYFGPSSRPRLQSSQQARGSWMGAGQKLPRPAGNRGRLGKWTLKVWGQRHPAALPALLPPTATPQSLHPAPPSAMTHVYRGCSCKCDVFWGAWYP